MSVRAIWIKITTMSRTIRAWHVPGLLQVFGIGYMIQQIPASSAEARQMLGGQSVAGVGVTQVARCHPQPRKQRCRKGRQLQDAGFKFRST